MANRRPFPSADQFFGLQYHHGGAFPQIQTVAVGIEGFAGSAVGVHERNKTVVSDLIQFVDAAGDNGVADTLANPCGRQADGIGTGGACIYHRLAGTGQLKLLGNVNGWIAQQKPVIRRHNGNLRL